jgi:lipoprotein-anchoring transpeptidase ErfK/SrfK
MIRVDGLEASMATGKLEPFRADYRSSSSAAFSKSLWRIGVLTAAGAIGVASQADATIFWPDSDSGFYQAAPATVAPRQKRRVRHHSEGRSEGGSRKGQKEVEAQVQETAKPHGPLVIAISINKQTMKIYDTNGFFAETPVSTGMRGHPTPMGVFSVVQKEKLHHSNIYSGAPMPYMQRITWSGIAMHAGVLPGHPASHGCIRMPAAFALKMYGWTRMGARVVITPDELVPTNFSHPMLVAQKVVPQPVAADEPAVKADKATNMATAKPATSEASLELRSTVGHDSGPKSLTDAAPASALLRDQTRTADASAFPITKSPVVMSDATSSGAEAAKLEPAKPQPAKSETESAAAERAEGASGQVDSAQVDSAQVASTDDKAVETPPAATPEIKSAETDADKAGKQPDQAAASVPASEDAAKTPAAAPESIKADASKTEPKTDQVKTDEVKAEQVKAAAMNTATPKPTAKPADSVKAATDVSSVPDPRKDQGRLTGTEKAPAPKTAAEKRAAAKEAAKAAAEAVRRSGPISVFVSRKDSKLYVRQGFAPLFDVPVTIAPGDRPLGTHVFTAEVDKDDANVVHWSVVTLPKPTRAERRDEDERASRRRKVAGAAEIKAPTPEPDSPAEALDRLTIPEEAKARITDALTTASSIIVSDQGIAGGETGQGTDFIVSLR